MENQQGYEVGRVFLDMDWNYDRIYGLADQTLLTLHHNIVQNMDE